MEYLELGSAPSDENCVQVSSTRNYYEEMKEELQRYKLMLQKRFSFVQNSCCYFSVKWEQHDFGSYGEVVIKYPETEEGVKIAFFVEENLPSNWNEQEIFLQVE